ncbi:MAG: glycosyltransferase family A protein, partial [Phenylobacterium sp.]|uniref:glycosyltransferase family 2 protein n=1 Tax=Phenylobacterium sp. TaxID=1871053 RepID=UPI00271D558B
MSVTLFDNPLWDRAQPRLSVLIPFKGDDPCPLLAALGREAVAVAVEIIILDDGTGDPALSAAVQAVVADLPLPTRLVTLAANEGRAKGRNRLVSHARAGHFLFLDSDMAPDSAGFLSTWLGLIAQDDPAVAFGGFSLQQVEPRRDQALHRAMAAHSDCLSASERSLS